MKGAPYVGRYVQVRLVGVHGGAIVIRQLYGAHMRVERPNNGWSSPRTFHEHLSRVVETMSVLVQLAHFHKRRWKRASDSVNQAPPVRF
jgi:hypothetical protein